MPHTIFDLKVLEFACKKNPKDATAAYLLGLILLSKQRVDEAVKFLDAAAVLPNHSPLCHIAQYLAYREQGWSASGLKVPLMEALKEKPDLQYAALELNNLCVQQNVPVTARLDQLNAAIKAAGESASEELSRTVIMTLIERGDLKAAAGKMGEREYHTWEGGHGIRPTWWNVHLIWARRLMKEKRYAEALEKVRQSMEFPKNLFAEESNFGLEGYETNYWKGHILTALGKGEEAREAFKASALWKPFQAGNAGEDGRHLTYHRLFAALSLKELGDKTQAGTLLSEFSTGFKKRSLDPLAEVLFLHISGQVKAARARAEVVLKDMPIDVERLLLLEYLSGNFLL
jgi:tetratricopeptide (TPR) repeat protein